MQVGIVGMGIMGRLLAFAWQVTLFAQGTGDTNGNLAAASLLISE